MLTLLILIHFDNSPFRSVASHLGRARTLNSNFLLFIENLLLKRLCFFYRWVSWISPSHHNPVEKIKARQVALWCFCVLFPATRLCPVIYVTVSPLPRKACTRLKKTCFCIPATSLSNIWYYLPVVFFSRLPLCGVMMAVVQFKVNLLQELLLQLFLFCQLLVGYLIDTN